MNNELRTRHNGFTLAEAMMATVVLAIAAAAVMVPFVTGASVRAEGLHRTLAAKLAADLTEQIIKTPFDQIVTTYDGYAEPTGQIKDSTDAVFTDSSYARFSRDATCTYFTVPQHSGPAQQNFILATVRVYYDGGEIALINRLISK